MTAAEATDYLVAAIKKGMTILDPEASATFIRTHVPGAHNLQGDQLVAVQDLLEVFCEALGVFVERNRRYQDLWRRAGWIANLLQTRHKSDRLMNQFWNKDNPNTDLDDLYDMMNYAAFFAISVRNEDSMGSLF